MYKRRRFNADVNKADESMLRMGIAIACILATASGCIDLELSGKEEHIGLTYKQYCDRFALRDFNPVGAKSISYLGSTGRDSYDSWWRIEIARPGWLNICKQIGLGKPERYSPDSNDHFGVPDTWPEPLSPSCPSWWEPAAGFGSALLTSQVQWKSGKRATGWYWLYDDKSSTAIGWHWNRQFWKLETHERRGSPFKGEQGEQAVETWLGRTESNGDFEPRGEINSR